MEAPPTTTGQLAQASKRFVSRLMTIGENRFALLMVEVQEEFERLLRAILLALGVAACGLLAGALLSAAVVLLFPEAWRLGALLVLAGLYAAVAICLYRRLARLLRQWKSFPATVDQLHKDRTCLEKHLT